MRSDGRSAEEQAVPVQAGGFRLRESAQVGGLESHDRFLARHLGATETPQRHPAVDERELAEVLVASGPAADLGAFDVQGHWGFVAKLEHHAVDAALDELPRAGRIDGGWRFGGRAGGGSAATGGDDQERGEHRHDGSHHGRETPARTGRLRQAGAGAAAPCVDRASSAAASSSAFSATATGWSP